MLRPGITLDSALTKTLKDNIRQALSARHVPNETLVVPEVPRTLSGKKMELPVKKLLLGMPIEKIANRDAMSNPDSLDYFVAFAQQRLSAATEGTNGS